MFGKQGIAKHKQAATNSSEGRVKSEEGASAESDVSDEAFVDKQEIAVKTEPADTAVKQEPASDVKLVPDAGMK